MKKMQKGFTLIELMIVVAIIAILAAIALPAYQNYVIRSKVTEAMVAADACKTSIVEYYQSMAKLPATMSSSGCVNQVTNYVTSLAVTPTTGVITVALNSTNVGTGGNLVLKPTASTDGNNELIWACNSGAGTTIAAQYLPPLCR
jgi:type IV pilus assembly protein PilA